MSVKKWDKAKEKDKEGKYARIGMEAMCALWFDIETRNSACVKAIVDDYLETVNMDVIYKMVLEMTLHQSLQELTIFFMLTSILIIAYK